MLNSQHPQVEEMDMLDFWNYVMATYPERRRLVVIRGQLVWYLYMSVRFVDFP